MKIFSAFFVVLLASLPGSAQTSEATSLPTGNKPNIVYILADDLGYGELGAYGQELIETPNIDALAREGMRFTQHYSGAPVCAPARCVLLTGLHTGHAHIRGNDEWGERGKVWDYQAMFENPFLEGQRPLPDSVITIAELLKGAGYATGAVGKWGLGDVGRQRLADGRHRVRRSVRGDAAARVGLGADPLSVLARPRRARIRL